MEKEYFAHETAVIDEGCSNRKRHEDLAFFTYHEPLHDRGELQHRAECGGFTGCCPGQECKGSEQCFHLYRCDL